MSIATLSIDIEAKLAKLEAGLTKAEWMTSKSMRKVQAEVKAFEASLAKVGGVLSGALASSILAQGFNNAIQGLDALNDAADATGASLGKLSALEDFGLRTGTAFSTITDMLVKLNGELNKATPGSGTEQALAAIGLNAAELKSLDPADALQRIAKALAGYADDGNKARLVQELFGKSVQQAAPVLKDLAEAGELQAKATIEQTAAAEAYIKSLAQMQADLTALGRSLAAEVAPVFTGFLGELRDGIEVFGSFGAALKSIGWGTSPFDTLAETMANTRDQIAELKEEAEDLEQRIAKPLTAIDRLWSGGRNAEQLKSLRAEIETQEKLLQYLQRRQAAGVRQADYSNEGRVVLPSVKAPSSKDKAARKAVPQADRFDALGFFIEDLEDSRKMWAQLDAEFSRELERRNAEQQRLAVEAERFGEQLVAQTEAINVALLGSDRARGEAQIELDRKTLQKRLDELQVYGAERERRQAELDANIAARQAALTEQLKPEWQRMLEAWADTTEHMARVYDDFTTGLLSGTEDVFAEFVRTGKLNFDSLADYALQTISRIIAQRAILGLAEGIGSVLVPSGFANASPNAKGNIFDPRGLVTAFANGGVVSSPTYFGYDGGRRTGLMGEAGPEAIMPLSRGPDGKLGVRASAQGPTIVVNNHIASGVSRSELAAMLPAITAQVEASVFSRMRRPGFRG